MKYPHHLVHLLLQLEFGIGPEEFTPPATGLTCGITCRAWPVLRHNSLLDNHGGLLYTIYVNDKTAK